MGVGGTVAQGCNIGHGLTGLPLLSLGSAAGDRRDGRRRAWRWRASARCGDASANPGTRGRPIAGRSARLGSSRACTRSRSGRPRVAELTVFAAADGGRGRPRARRRVPRPPARRRPLPARARRADRGRRRGGAVSRSPRWAALRAALAFLFGVLAVGQRRDARPAHPRRRARAQRPHRRARLRRRIRARRARGRHPVAPPAARPRRVWAQRVLAALGVLGGILLVLGPSAMGIIEVHKWREPIGASPGPGYRDVAFRSSDGLKLTGWYRPSTNGATVLLVHGGNGDRPGPGAGTPACSSVRATASCSTTRAAAGTARARPTATAGTGATTSRARSPSSKAAPTSTRTGSARSGSRPAPTCSSRSPPTARTSRAIVADGTAAERLGGLAPPARDEAGMVPGWVMFKTIEVLSGDPPSPALEDRVAKIQQPTLMVSAGTAEEYEFGVLYDQAATRTSSTGTCRRPATRPPSARAGALRGARHGVLRPRAALKERRQARRRARRTARASASRGRARASGPRRRRPGRRPPRPRATRPPCRARRTRRRRAARPARTGSSAARAARGAGRAGRAARRRRRRSGRAEHDDRAAGQARVVRLERADDRRTARRRARRGASKVQRSRPAHARRGTSRRSRRGRPPRGRCRRAAPPAPGRA